MPPLPPIVMTPVSDSAPGPAIVPPVHWKRPAGKLNVAPPAPMAMVPAGSPTVPPPLPVYVPVSVGVVPLLLRLIVAPFNAL